jgi:hypothetical protein
VLTEDDKVLTIRASQITPVPGEINPNCRREFLAGSGASAKVLLLGLRSGILGVAVLLACLRCCGHKRGGGPKGPPFSFRRGRGDGLKVKPRALLGRGKKRSRKKIVGLLRWLSEVNLSPRSQKTNRDKRGPSRGKPNPIGTDGIKTSPPRHRGC